MCWSHSITRVWWYDIIDLRTRSVCLVPPVFIRPLFASLQLTIATDVLKDPLTDTSSPLNSRFHVAIKQAASVIHPSSFLLGLIPPCSLKSSPREATLIFFFFLFFSDSTLCSTLHTQTHLLSLFPVWKLYPRRRRGDCDSPVFKPTNPICCWNSSRRAEPGANQ